MLCISGIINSYIVSMAETANRNKSGVESRDSSRALVTIGLWIFLAAERASRSRRWSKTGWKIMICITVKDKVHPTHSDKALWLLIPRNYRKHDPKFISHVTGVSQQFSDRQRLCHSLFCNKILLWVFWEKFREETPYVTSHLHWTKCLSLIWSLLIVPLAIWVFNSIFRAGRGKISNTANVCAGSSHNAHHRSSASKVRPSHSLRMKWSRRLSGHEFVWVRPMKCVSATDHPCVSIFITVDRTSMDNRYQIKVTREHGYPGIWSRITISSDWNIVHKSCLFQFYSSGAFYHARLCGHAFWVDSNSCQSRFARDTNNSRDKSRLIFGCSRPW